MNYNHLRYFREVAREGHLTRAAERLNLSQSALSTQIKQFEERLGHPLFARIGRRLELTEAGQIALAHAERIFAAGDELLATLDQTSHGTRPLRIGAQSTLSRNFQIRFLAPVLGTELSVLRSGTARALTQALRALELDVVLATQPPEDADILGQSIAEQDVQLHGRPDLIGASTLPALLAEGALILPSESEIHSGFLALAAEHGVSPRIAADVDDMAMVRLLARAGAGLAVAPPVVLADELAQGILATAPHDLGISERFFALTAPRQYPHPLLAPLLRAARVSKRGGSA